MTVNDFQQELNKYNVSVDKSYIKGVVSQINLELGRQLLNKAKENILKSIIISSNDTIKFLTAEDLIENYGIPNTCVNEIMDYVNNGITRENKKRKSSIQNKQMITNSQDLPLKDADNKENRNDLFTKYPGFKRLYECFMELADTEIQKDAIEQIMKFGKFNNFKLNSMLSNEKYSQKTEMERRITFSEMVLYDKNLFFYLVNHGLNVFHGTKTDALQTILSKGLFSSAKLNEEGIKLTTGEEYTTNMLFQANAEKRNFVSLTDNFNNAASYADFPYEEQTEYAKKYYGKDLKVEKNIPIIICFSNTDIEQKYGKSLVMVKSTCNEIGINSSINSSDIKCIITSYDKMEYVKSLVAPYKIDVLGYNYNNTFQKRLINDKKEKFYTILNSDIVVDEQEFENCKARIKEKLKESSRNNITEHLDKDLSMMAASTLKNDLALDLIEQYNNGIMVTPIMASNLINKYNINEEIAEQLASEINAMVKLYVQEKEKQKNDTPYVLDDYNEEKEEMLQSHR